MNAPLTPNALADVRAVAHFVRRLAGWQGDARLYRCEPPLKGNAYVVVSAVDATFSGPETYVFAADVDGNVNDYRELDGSFRGGLDHAEALRGAGYEVVEAAAARESGGG